MGIICVHHKGGGLLKGRIALTFSVELILLVMFLKF